MPHSPHRPKKPSAVDTAAAGSDQAAPVALPASAHHVIVQLGCKWIGANTVIGFLRSLTGMAMGLAVLAAALAMPGNAEAHELVSDIDSPMLAAVDSWPMDTPISEIRVNAAECPLDQLTSCCTMGCCVAVSPYVAPARAPGAVIMPPPSRITTIRSRNVLPPLKPPKPAA